MSDLVKRLRHCDQNSVQHINGSKIFGEAADAIADLVAENARLRAENKRLRLELEAAEQRVAIQRAARDALVQQQGIGL